MKLRRKSALIVAMVVVAVLVGTALLLHSPALQDQLRHLHVIQVGPAAVSAPAGSVAPLVIRTRTPDHSKALPQVAPGSDGLIYGHLGKLAATAGGIGVSMNFRDSGHRSGDGARATPFGDFAPMAIRSGRSPPPRSPKAAQKSRARPCCEPWDAPESARLSLAPRLHASDTAAPRATPCE
jgi:hypothetical protein